MRPRKQVSLLVPFRSTDPGRLRVWFWLWLYWRKQLPDAELVVGRDWRSHKRWFREPKPFSKSTAVNDAFSRSHGDIIVILDADTYIPGKVIEHCARRLRAAREAGVRTWFIPYWHLYRLRREATEAVLESEPWHPLRFPSPPPVCDVEGTDGSGWGQHFGALIQIMPREAFEVVGGMDPRFRGWGGEDVAFLKALDRLWGKHKNTTNDVLHLWHPQLSFGSWTDQRGKSWKTRMWSGQERPRANDWLARLYNNAAGDVAKMRRLVDEGHAGNASRLVDRLYSLIGKGLE